MADHCATWHLPLGNAAPSSAPSATSQGGANLTTFCLLQHVVAGVYTLLLVSTRAPYLQQPRKEVRTLLSSSTCCRWCLHVIAGVFTLLLVSTRPQHLQQPRKEVHTLLPACPHGAYTTSLVSAHHCLLLYIVAGVYTSLLMSSCYCQLLHVASGDHVQLLVFTRYDWCLNITVGVCKSVLLVSTCHV